MRYLDISHINLLHFCMNNLLKIGSNDQVVDTHNYDYYLLPLLFEVDFWVVWILGESMLYYISIYLDVPVLGSLFETMEGFNVSANYLFLTRCHLSFRLGHVDVARHFSFTYNGLSN